MTLTALTGDSAPFVDHSVQVPTSDDTTLVNGEPVAAALDRPWSAFTGGSVGSP